MAPVNFPNPRRPGVSLPMSLVVITRLVPLVLPPIVEVMRCRLYILEGLRPEMIRVSTEAFTATPEEKSWQHFAIVSETKRKAVEQ